MEDIEKSDVEKGRSSPESQDSRLESSHSSIHTVEEHGDVIGKDSLKKAEQPSLSRQLSRISTRLSAVYPPRVARAERRGLLARFAVIPEVTQPYNYPRKTKWTVTFVVAVAAMAAPMGSAIVMPTLTPIARDFGASPAVTNLSVALYMLAMAIFPLWWSSFSETLGRRTIYLVSFVLFTVFAILSAVSTSIGMLIAMRLLSGGAAASVQAVGGGTIADIWEPKERGKAMGLFYLGPLCGPLLGPIIGGAIAQDLGWRATQWFLVVYGGITLVFLVFALPETLRQRKAVVDVVETEEQSQVVQESEKSNDDVESKSVAPSRPSANLRRTTTRQSVAQNSKKYLVFLRRAFLEPLKIILLLRYPVVAVTVYYAAITFGSLYVLNISIEDTFSKPPYNFQTSIVGLMYIPGSLGYLIASLFGGRWLDHIMKREAKKAGRYDDDGNLIFRPEDRMRENAWFAAFAFPIALIWYGWTAEKGVHWIVPMIANFFFGCGSMIVFACVTTMLTEFMPRKASTGIAANNFIRGIFAAIGGVVAQPIIEAIGDGWLFTILGIVSLISGCIVIWSVKKFGSRWRESMDRKMQE